MAVFSKNCGGKLRQMQNRPELRNNLEKMRKRAGLTREELAERMDTSDTTIYRKENGEREIKLHELPEFAKHLDCSFIEIISDLPTEPVAQSPAATKIDPMIFEGSMQVMLRAAHSRGEKLEGERLAMLTMEMYNHIIEMSANGLSATPSESSAFLILKSAG